MQSQSICNLINGQQLILRHVQRLRLQVTLETSNAKEKKKEKNGFWKVLSAPSGNLWRLLTSHDCFCSKIPQLPECKTHQITMTQWLSPLPHSVKVPTSVKTETYKEQ